MINSYFRTTINKPTIPTYTTQTKLLAQKNNQPKYRRYNIIILILNKALIKTYKLTFNAINQYSKIVPQTLNKITQLCEKNTNLTVFLAFQKIKLAASQQKSNQKILKNVVQLLQRIQKYKLKQSFSKLILHNTRNYRNFIDVFQAERPATFSRKLALLFKRQKKSVFDKMIAWGRFIKSYSKLRVIPIIRGRLQKHAKQIFFSRIHRFLLKKGGKGVAEKEVGQLKTQLQDLAVQLQNKNQNIERLQTEISQLKIQKSNMSFNQNCSYGEYNTSKNVMKTYSQKKLSFNDKSARGSAVGSNEEISINDMSIGSILGNLNKSRTGSMSKMGSNCQCSCGYRNKYLKYKNTNQSLKNQLEIVKQELQVAKDLNEHFTNQIKQYLTGEGNEGDYQRLKRENQSLVDQRDQLRQKVFKYQKHINNLKAQFKVKMQELYRKVRKNEV